MKYPTNCPMKVSGERDNTPLTFGKYKGHTPESVSVSDPGYIVWLYENVNPKQCSKALYHDASDAVNEDCETLEMLRGDFDDWGDQD